MKRELNVWNKVAFWLRHSPAGSLTLWSRIHGQVDTLTHTRCLALLGSYSYSHSLDNERSSK